MHKTQVQMDQRSQYNAKHIENENTSIFITMHKTEVQIDQRPQYKANHIEPHRRESGNYT